MDGVTFQAQVQVGRQANMMMTFSLFGVLILVSGMMVLSVARGNRFALFMIALLPLLVSGIRNSSVTSKSLQTIAALRVTQDSLELSLPGTRMSEDSLPANQCYVSKLEDTIGVRLSNGTMVLLSRRLWSIGLTDGVEFVREDLGQGSVTVSILDDDVSRISDYLTSCGIPIEK